VRLFRLVTIASCIVEDELTMKSTRLEKIRKPTNAANPLTRVPDHRLVRQPTNNDKLSATFSRWYRSKSICSASPKQFEGTMQFLALQLADRQTAFSES
jgi:hypothetical protein